MRDVLVTLLIFGAIPAIIARPYIGILVFSWIGYMNPHRLTWGFAYDMPFAAIIGGLTLVLLPLTKEKGKIPLSAMTFTWFAWIAWMNISTIFSLVPDAFGYEWNRAVKIQLMALVTIVLLQSPQKIKYLVGVLVVSIGYYSTKGGLFTIMTAGNFIVWGAPGSFFEGNNALAITVLMVVPLMRFLQLEASNAWVKRVLLGMMVLSLFSVLASYSRGAFLAAAAVGFYFILKSRRKMILLLIIPVAIISVLLFMPEKYHERLGTIQTYEEDASAMGRINAWMFAYNLAKDHPLTGGGFGVFLPGFFKVYAPEPDDYHDAHSIYFEVLGEHGFVGLFLFVLLGWLALMESRKLRRQTMASDELRWAYNLISMLHVSLIAYAVGGLFLGLAYFDLYYHLLALIVLTRIEVDKRLAEPRTSHFVEADEHRRDEVRAPLVTYNANKNLTQSRL